MLNTVPLEDSLFFDSPVLGNKHIIVAYLANNPRLDSIADLPRICWGRLVLNRRKEDKIGRDFVKDLRVKTSSIPRGPIRSWSLCCLPF